MRIEIQASQNCKKEKFNSFCHELFSVLTLLAMVSKKRKFGFRGLEINIRKRVL